MTLLQERAWPVASALFLITIFCLLAASSTVASASCQGATEMSQEHVTALRTLLSPGTAPGDFHVYAEAPSADRQIHFVLYSVSQPADLSEHTVYLAAMSLAPRPSIVSAVDVSTYLPPFARAARSQADAPSSDASLAAESPAIAIDGCLNAFVLQPDLEAVHMNLFARSARHQSEGANDIVFVLLDHSSLRPVLELNQSSWQDKRLHQDSVIAVLPSTAMATDLIWRQSSQQGSGIMSASYDQNRWYRWNGKEFEKMGTLEDTDLAARLRSASLLTRSDAISTVDVKLMTPDPKQPPQ